MFSRQAPAIHTALWLGGLSPAMASQVQNLLGQCRAQLVHRGPLTLDYTRPSMRLVTPESAKFQYPQLEDVGQPPEEEEEEEEEVGEEPPPGDPPFPPPQQFPEPPDAPAPANQNLKAGDYIDIAQDLIHLKHFDQGRGALGRNCTFQQGEVKGVVYETSNINFRLPGLQQRDQHILLRWDEQQAGKTVLEYGLKDLRGFRVVEDVKFYPEGVPSADYGGDGSPGIVVKYRTIMAWDSGLAAENSIIPLSECEDDSGSTPRSPEPVDAPGP